jgi:NAD(P)-dependent dehydrogenase (short-subunit alcohol dehydrogenase family)
MGSRLLLVHFQNRTRRICRNLSRSSQAQARVSGRPRLFRWFATFGAIVLAARSGGKLGEVGQQANAIGAESLVLELDLMAPTAPEVVVKKTLDRFGRIDALVNIAGAVAGLDVFRMTDQQWNTGMELKFHGARRLTIRAWDALRESKGAVVTLARLKPAFRQNGTLTAGNAFRVRLVGDGR